VPISFDSGGVVAIADGPELLVYQSSDGSPIWKEFCDGILVDVAVAGGRLVSLDSEGTVTWWRLADGLREDSASVGGGATGLAVAGEGQVAVVTPHGLSVIGGAPLSLPQVSAAAFGPGAGSVGIGTHTGVFTAIDPATGAAWGSVDLGAPVTGVAWSQQGTWVVTSGNRVVVIRGDGAEQVASIQGPGPLVAISCSENGLLAAAVCGAHQVACFELHTHRAIGSIDLKREIAGVDFGSAAMLAIGIDDGDASLIDLFTGKVGRTEPQPGRGRNTWAVKVGVDQAAVRGAAALSKAGGVPIAKYIPIPEDEDDDGCLKSCITIVAISTLVCMGCTGCSGLLYVLRAVGVF